MILYSSVELMVQFSSTHFKGSEISKEILVNVTISGGTSHQMITLPISLNGVTAMGQSLNCCIFQNVLD